MRRLCAILAVIAVATALAGCESVHGKSPFETSLPSSKAGFRITDGELHIWTGAPCAGTTSITARFWNPQSGDTELQLITPTYDEKLTPGVEFEYLALEGPYPAGFEVFTPLPPGFDWRAAQRLSLHVDGPPNSRGPLIDFTPIVTEITENSSEHPEDTYYFFDLGWLNPAEVAARDGKDFMTVCTPDPVEESGRLLFGVRVTDGTLRFWTGAPCIGDTGVILTFQPGQADLVLNRTELLPERLEYLTLGGPYPGFTATHPLPRDFDWHKADSVLLRINFNVLTWATPTSLAAPIAESSQHPPDTYYFQGIGWLNPADVAARDGTSMHTICGT